jgi:hypothetical protein
MNKVEMKKQAIAEVADLMKKYTEYVESIKDKPFTTEIREQLRSKGNIIRWLQQGLESGYYES